MMADIYDSERQRGGCKVAETERETERDDSERLRGLGSRWTDRHLQF